MLVSQKDEQQFPATSINECPKICFWTTGKLSAVKSLSLALDHDLVIFVRSFVRPTVRSFIHSFIGQWSTILFKSWRQLMTIPMCSASRTICYLPSTG